MLIIASNDAISLFHELHCSIKTSEKTAKLHCILIKFQIYAW